MKTMEIHGQPGIRVEVIGEPWDRKKHGPPYVRLETLDGKYLFSPNYKELVELQKIIARMIRYEREFDPRKRPRKIHTHNRTPKGTP